jgi:hypothetical protein
MSDNIIRIDNGPTVVYTKLVWVISGPVPASGAACNFVETYSLRVDTQLDDKLQKIWDLETLGISDDEETICNKIDIQSKQGRYEVSLPWKEPYSVLPDNYNLGLKRLKGQLYHLRRNLSYFNSTTPSLMNSYNMISTKL